MKLVGFNERGKRCGETHHRAKFTDDEIETVLFLHATGLSSYAIAAKWDDGHKTMSPAYVRKLCNGQVRTTYPVTFRRIR